MLRLGSVGKTTIDIDSSFIFLLGLWVVFSYSPRQGIEYALLWAPVLLISVLIHELAHAAMNATLGFGASQIILGGMGGMTINERRAKPWQDFLISIAGPLSNFALALLIHLLAGQVEVMRTDRMLVALVPRLIGANVFWGIFNLIPVPPLDGGHAVRSFLRMFLKDRTAFIIAVWIAIVSGGAIAVFAAVNQQFFLALFMAWFAWQNFQAWQYFREHGTPGN